MSLPKNSRRGFERRSAPLLRHGSFHRLSQQTGIYKCATEDRRPPWAHLAQIALDAERLFEKVRSGHVAATSCLTYYEVEEALYRMLVQSTKGVSHADTLLIPAARSITTQVQMVIDLFNISVLDLTSTTVRLQLQQLELQTRGVRAADALHAASAIAFDADMLVSTDETLLQLDEVLVNGRSRKILCRDTDFSVRLL